MTAQAPIKRQRCNDGQMSATGEAVRADDQSELLREAMTMALYVAICLLAALALITDSEAEHDGTVFKVIWGTTVGLALAHWVAFRLAARLLSGGRPSRHDGEAAIAQLSGAVLVAVVATLPVVFLDASAELDWARIAISVAVAGGLTVGAKANGASTPRAIVADAAGLVVAIAIALVKNSISGH